jgi:hypothetical protein
MANGNARTVRGTLVAFDGVGWLATVRLDGSAAQVLEGVAANRGLDAASLVPGLRCLVDLGAAHDPGEMLLVAVYG